MKVIEPELTAFVTEAKKMCDALLRGDWYDRNGFTLSTTQKKEQYLRTPPSI